MVADNFGLAWYVNRQRRLQAKESSALPAKAPRPHRLCVSCRHFGFLFVAATLEHLGDAGRQARPSSDLCRHMTSTSRIMIQVQRCRCSIATLPPLTVEKGLHRVVTVPSTFSSIVMEFMAHLYKLYGYGLCKGKPVPPKLEYPPGNQNEMAFSKGGICQFPRGYSLKVLSYLHFKTYT